jgi:recombination protein RecT
MEVLRRETGVQNKPTAPMTVPQMLDKYKAEIARALPKHLSADRMARIALTAFRQNADLMKCEPRSVFAAIVISAQLGLEIGQLGQAYLVPYNVKRDNEWVKECQFIPGWKGMVDLVNRAGRACVWTGAVYEGDEFEYERGTTVRIHHKEKWQSEKLTHVYAVGQVKGAEFPVIEVWPIEKVRRHRDRFNKVGTKHYSFQHEEAYARKVVLLQVIKYMPVSAEMSQAYDLDVAAETTGQKLDLANVSDGYMLPSPTEEETTEEPQKVQTEPEKQNETDNPIEARFIRLGWDQVQRDVFNRKHLKSSDEDILAELDGLLEGE